MTIQFYVASSPVPAIKGFVRDLTKAVNDQIEADAIVTKIDAQNNHRYTVRTGNLRRNTTFKMDRRISAVKFYIDDVKAHYGKFIHDGFKTWSPDPFLSKAVTKGMKRTYTSVTKTINKLIKKYKLG